jgi:hypothetical protein
MNIFSPGSNNPKSSPSSDSSASYVDPDATGKITKKDIAETTAPSVRNLENSTADTSNAIEESRDNPTKVVPLDGEVETNANSEDVIPKNEVITEAIANDPPQDITIGNGDDEVMTGDGPTLNSPEEWTTIIDRKLEQKNRKARKNKEHKQKKQAKLLRRQARHGPAWAQQGGVLPASSGSGSGSPKHSSSDSTQNSQLQEIRGDESNSNGSPGEPGERSNPESRASFQPDPNLSKGSQGGGDDETKTEGSNSGNQLDFY